MVLPNAIEGTAGLKVNQNGKLTLLLNIDLIYDKYKQANEIYSFLI